MRSFKNNVLGLKLIDTYVIYPIWIFYDFETIHFSTSLHPPKRNDRYAQLTRGSFKINNFLRNPHFRSRDKKVRTIRISQTQMHFEENSPLEFQLLFRLPTAGGVRESRES